MLRIWDCLFSEGSTVLLRVGLVIISKHSDVILRCRSTAEILDVFREIHTSPHVTRCHEFMQVSLLSVYCEEKQEMLLVHCFLICSSISHCRFEMAI